MDMFARKENVGGAVAATTVKTLSKQLSKTVFTKIKFLLSGLHFFMDDWFHFTSKRGDFGLDWTCNLSVTDLSCRPPCLDNIMWTVMYVLYPHRTSYTIIKLSSGAALVRISSAKWGCAGEIQQKQGAGWCQSPPLWRKESRIWQSPCSCFCSLLRKQ